MAMGTLVLEQKHNSLAPEHKITGLLTFAVLSFTCLEAFVSYPVQKMLMGSLPVMTGFTSVLFLLYFLGLFDTNTVTRSLYLVALVAMAAVRFTPLSDNLLLPSFLTLGGHAILLILLYARRFADNKYFSNLVLAGLLVPVSGAGLVFANPHWLHEKGHNAYEGLSLLTIFFFLLAFYYYIKIENRCASHRLVFPGTKSEFRLNRSLLAFFVLMFSFAALNLFFHDKQLMLVPLFFTAFFIFIINRFQTIGNLLHKNDELVQKNFDQQLEQTKQQKMLYNILAHDLRSPSASIKGLMQVIELEGRDSPRIEKIHNLIADAVDRQLDLIENYIRWARETGIAERAQNERFAVNRLFTELYDYFEAALDYKQLNLTLPDSSRETVYTDYKMLTAVLRNAVSNAVKHSETGSTVELNCVKTTTGYTVITVTDHGDGIEAEQLDQMLTKPSFKPVYHKDDGYGLGMQIIHEFSRRINARVMGCSTRGKGTTIAVFLRDSIAS